MSTSLLPSIDTEDIYAVCGSSRLAPAVLNAVSAQTRMIRGGGMTEDDV